MVSVRARPVINDLLTKRSTSVLADRRTVDFTKSYISSGNVKVMRRVIFIVLAVAGTVDWYQFDGRYFATARHIARQAFGL